MWFRIYGPARWKAGREDVLHNHLQQAQFWIGALRYSQQIPPARLGRDGIGNPVRAGGPMWTLALETCSRNPFEISGHCELVECGRRR